MKAQYADVYTYFKGKHNRYEKVGEKRIRSDKEFNDYVRRWIGKAIQKFDKVQSGYSNLLGHVTIIYSGALKFEVVYRDFFGYRL
jgi:hypothetical protein